MLNVNYTLGKLKQEVMETGEDEKVTRRCQIKQTVLQCLQFSVIMSLRKLCMQVNGFSFVLFVDRQLVFLTFC
jgi:exosome complex RNA-binding protein Rrp42 (RNase PH superfamily)